MHEELAQVGARLRAARQRAGLTLDELATRAGMSASTLSRLESGKRQANLELLVPLTRQLGIRIDDLLDAGPHDPRVRRDSVRRGDTTVTPLTPEASPIRAFRIEFDGGRPMPEQRVHDGHDWVYVLSGRLRLRLDDHEHVLGRGEAAEFDTSRPHAMAAAGTRPAIVVSIFNEEGARVHLHGG